MDQSSTVSEVLVLQLATVHSTNRVEEKKKILGRGVTLNVRKSRLKEKTSPIARRTHIEISFKKMCSTVESIICTVPNFVVHVN